MSKVLIAIYASIVAVSLGAGFLLFHTYTNYAEQLQVSEVTARVHSVGPKINVPYQCGSSKIGDVDVPVYCNRDEYDVTYVISEADKFIVNREQSAPTIGSNALAYKIVNNELRTEYSLSNPQSMGSHIGMGVISAILSGVLMTIGIIVTRRFTS